MFIKKDEKNKFRKDSSFYYDGYWEVFEFDDALRETRFRTASGVGSLRKYDYKNRLKEYYRIGEKGDTLKSEQYEWQDGLLVRMTANDVVRNYIYGKTLRDPVRVEPSDEGFNYHRGYNGTAGKIPEEGTLDYETFSRNPYGHVHFGEEEEEDEEDEYEQGNISFAAKKTSGSLNVLARTTSSGCVTKIDGFPAARCVRFTKNDALTSITRQNVEDVLFYGYPCGETSPIFGMSSFKLSVTHTCKCNESGKYQPYFTGKITNPSIEVYQNSWIYESFRNDWSERCWHPEDLMRTYRHEIEHIKNGKRIADVVNSFTLRFEVNTQRECEKNVEQERQIIKDMWDEWYENEIGHVNPSSPRYTGPRLPDVCR
jgi:hypothetical protein